MKLRARSAVISVFFATAFAEDAPEVVRALRGLWNSWPSRLPSNSTTDAPLLGNGMLGCAIGRLPYMKEPKPQGDITWYLGSNSFWVAPAQGISQCGFRDADNNYALGMVGGGVKQIGGVTFSSPLISSEAFHAEQHFSDASVLTEHGAALSTTSYVHATEDALITYVTIGPERLDVNLTAWTVGSDGGPTNLRSSCNLPTDAGILEWEDTPILWAARAAGYAYQNTATFNVTSIAFATRVLAISGGPPLVLGTDVTRSSTGNTSASVHFRFEARSQMAIVTTFATSRAGTVDGKQFLPHVEAAVHTKKMNVTTLSGMLASHQKWWGDYWIRSWFRLDTGNASLDSMLHKLYYGSLYWLALSSRSSGVAPGLYGPFISTDFALWGNDFHMNYNFQDPYLGVFTANRPELADAYAKAVLQFVPRARIAAREMHNCPGLLFAGSIGPDGMYANHVGDMGQKKNALYSAIVFATQWFITRNVSTLNRLYGAHGSQYTMMCETIEFWMCYLQWNPQKRKLEDVNDCVGELCMDDPWHVHVNPTFTLSALRFVVGALIDISSLTGQDANLTKGWWTLLCSLAPYATVTIDGVEVTAERDGSTNVDTTSTIFPGGPAPTIKSCEGDPSYADLRAGVRRAIAVTGGRWRSSTEKIYVAAALAFTKADEFWAHVRDDLLLPCRGAPKEPLFGELCLYENGILDNNNGGGLETAGGIEWVHSIFLQSRDGVIRLFPMLPEGTKHLEFHRFLSIGAFEISARYANGTVGQPVRVLSRVGGILRIQSPPGWNGLLAARAVDGSREVAARASVDENIFIFDTLPGASYDLFQGLPDASFGAII